MKKIILLTLIILFTISLISCQKEELPKEKLPSQAIEEQEKVPTIEEKEPTPEVPEVSEEPKEEPKKEDPFPFVEEMSVTLDSGEVVLPAEDKDTKEIIISFPDDFTFGYTEPEITPPEDFEWGEYRPFVRYQTGRYGEMDSPVFSYAFLGEDIKKNEKTKIYNYINYFFNFKWMFFL